MKQVDGLFRRVPTLRALFVEVLSFQSLNTILNIALIRNLKLNIPDDIARSAFTGRLYATINAVSASLQFLVFPMLMKRLEPRWMWRLMPVLPLMLSIRQCVVVNKSLHWIAGAFVLAKVMDYSTRSVVYPMAYQPLDFESRYVGKEIIGVFGSRLGKSGMSLV